MVLTLDPTDIHHLKLPAMHELTLEDAKQHNTVTVIIFHPIYIFFLTLFIFVTKRNVI